LEELKLDDEHAKAIIDLGIEYEAYDSDAPETKKERLAAANEIIAFCIDAVITDDMTPDSDDPETAESGVKIAEILALAGVEIDEDDNVEFGELPDLDAEADEDEEDEDEEDEEDEDEAPFDPDDYIDGYTEMRVSEKVKAIGEALDPDDDDDVATLEALAEWENEQDKPSSRVLNTIEEMLGEEEDEDEADDNGDDEEPEAEADEDEPADEEPWEGYDKSSAVEIKKILSEQLEDEDEPLTAEQVEYVLDYERNREKPPPRKRVITFCEDLLKGFEEEAEEEKPKKSGGLKAQRDKKRDEAPAASNGVIVLTREQILTALDSGEVTIEL